MKAFSNVVLLDTSGTGFGVILTDTHITTCACVGDPPLHRDINCVGLAPALADVDGIMARTTCALHQLCVKLCISCNNSRLMAIYHQGYSAYKQFIG